MISEPAIPEDVAPLIDQKKLQEVEDLWTQRIEERPDDLQFFFAVAAAVKKKGGSGQVASWLRLLADAQTEKGDLDARLTVLGELARMFPTDEAIRKDLDEAVRERFASHPTLSAVLAQNPLASSKDPAAVASKIRRWLSFTPGGVYLLPGRGPGRIVELNPALDVIRLEFSGVKLPLSLVSAERTLVPLPEGHFLRERLEHSEQLRELAENDPAEAVRRLLASFGRPLSLGEVKEHFTGIVAEPSWAGFWTGARRHRQLLLTGSGKSATVEWSESADAAEESIRKDFAQASAAKKMELARKHGKRSKQLGADFARALAEQARTSAARSPALAWELSQAALRLAPGEPEAFPAEKLLAAGNTLSLLAEISDQAARGKALEAIRARREDWIEIFTEQFLHEDDQRVLAAIYQEFSEERRAELSRRILRSPKLAPRAFVWLAQGLHTEGIPPAGLFFSLLDALRQEEFSGVRSRVKEFFDAGALAVTLVRQAPSEEKAREMLESLNRAGGLEEHRRALVREALLMKFPELRAPAQEWVYSTAESIERKRQEVHHLKSVELPANAKAMQAAKELGDLSENFEYHSARQRHEYLSARIASIADELSRARSLDALRLDSSEVRVGTRVRFREIESGTERSVTILGPWDSKPEDAIYSYQSEFAQELLGHRAGERVRPSGVEVEILSIEPWR